MTDNYSDTSKCAFEIHHYKECLKEEKVSGKLIGTFLHALTLFAFFVGFRPGN